MLSGLPGTGDDLPFGGARYILKKQFFKLLGENFRIYDESERLVMFAHLKAFKLKEDIGIFSDETKTNQIFAIKARSIIDFSAAYDIWDLTTNEKVGALKRKGFRSIIRDEWIVMDASDREIGRIREEHVALALIRRFLTALVPQTFLFEIQGTQACEFRQHFNPFMTKMTIDFTRGNAELLDRRLAMCASILLAAMDSRSSMPLGG